MRSINLRNARRRPEGERLAMQRTALDERISADGIAVTLRKLTVDIGVRQAGTAGETSAAGYIAGQFSSAGADVATETFPVKSRAVTQQHLAIRINGAWVPFPSSLFSNTPGTGGRLVEAPLVWFEAPAEYRRADFSHLRGKAVIHLGCHIESRDAYRRLMDAKPAFLLFVDVRFPGTAPLADGMFPAYTRALGAVPTVNVAFMDAWRWKAEGAAAARLRVHGGMVDGESQNVIADLPGADPNAGILFAGAHHDTQADSPGADDNATGVAGLIQLANALAPLPRRRTIRLISFGAEEQLSVGSAVYVRRHRAELAATGRLMFNFDSIGSWMGVNELTCNGPAELRQTVVPYFERRGLYVTTIPDICPYTDHFPFVAAGVPGLWLWRRNCTTGRFFHHRPDDDISRVSPALMAELIRAAAEFIGDMANAEPLPFPVAVPADQAAQVQGFWEDLFGGWEG